MVLYYVPMMMNTHKSSTSLERQQSQGNLSTSCGRYEISNIQGSQGAALG
jgi:hypothetical protein